MDEVELLSRRSRLGGFIVVVSLVGITPLAQGFVTPRDYSGSFLVVIYALDWRCGVDLIQHPVEELRKIIHLLE